MIKPAMNRVASFAQIVATATGMMLGGAESASAQEPLRMHAPSSHLASLGLTDLENAFWACDYLSTTQRIGDVARCSAVTEALRERKFAGDVESMWAWWRQHKIARHRSVAASLDVATSQGAAHGQ